MHFFTVPWQKMHILLLKRNNIERQLLAVLPKRCTLQCTNAARTHTYDAKPKMCIIQRNETCTLRQPNTHTYTQV